MNLMRFSFRFLLIPLASIALAACDTTEAPQQARDDAPAVPVVTANAAMDRITDRIEAVGTTRAKESVSVTARVSNRVTAIRFSEGALVEKGDVLVELESSGARANLAAARADLVEIRSQVERSEKLIAEQVISQSVFDQQRAQMQAAEARVEAAESELRDHTLRAPFDGRVGLRRVSVGSQISPGDVITTIDDIGQMNLDFAVPESFFAALEAGQNISARTIAFPDETFTGTVETIDTRIDPVTRTVIVRALLPNEDARLRPGMFMTVILEKNPRDAIVVPEIALVPEGSSKYVFVIDNDQAVRREVTIGTRLPGRVEILSGLEAGEEYVVEGTQSLRNGSMIRRVEAPAGNSSQDTGQNDGGSSE
jgi:membrane fusion protein (multidrug efflux system)